MDMNEIKEIFFQECEEQLAELETGLLALNDGDTDPETVNAVFRAVHSIKGGAGAFGLDDLVCLSPTCSRQHLIAFDPTRSRRRKTF
jgi:two-component system chemotaxis sensor kinase CheA